MKEELLFVVSVLDLAYNTPIMEIKYAGADMSKAEDIYYKNTGDEKIITKLYLVQGKNSRVLLQSNNRLIGDYK